MNVFFVRHGETAANVDWTAFAWNHNEPLTAKGKLQAETATDIILSTSLKPLFLLSSPLIRAQQTAKIMGKRFGLSITTDERLVEGRVGDWQAKSVAEVIGLYNKIPLSEIDTFRFPHGETRAEWGQRIVRCFQDLSDDATVVVVTHSDSIAGAVGTLLNVSAKDWVYDKTPPGSVTYAVSDNGSWHIEFIGRLR